MATKKVGSKTPVKKVAPVKTTSTTNAPLSYETQMIIVILLLLFFYPIGLIFMWAWMGKWPLWLRILLTIPLFLGGFIIFSVLIFIAAIIQHVSTNYRMEQQRQQLMKQYLSPTPTVSQQALSPSADETNY